MHDRDALSVLKRVEDLLSGLLVDSSQQMITYVVQVMANQGKRGCVLAELEHYLSNIRLNEIFELRKSVFY